MPKTEIALDKPNRNKKLIIKGNILTVFTDGKLKGTKVKLDSIKNDSMPMGKFNPIFYPIGFEKIYLTTQKQPGKALNLFGEEYGA